MRNEVEWNSWMRLGPRLSLIICGVLIVQTILNDPSNDFRDEIPLQLQLTMPTVMSRTASNNTSTGSQSQIRAGASSVASSKWNDRRFLILEQDDRENMRGRHYLYRPSFWPPNNQDNNNDAPVKPVKGRNKTSKEPAIDRFLGESPTLTDFKESAVVPLKEFMVIDDIVPVVPIETASNRQGYATCQFKDYQYSFFFPHLTQQLFRCWSFWQGHEQKSPIFVTGREYNWKLAMDNEFNRGLIGAIQHAGVTVLNSSSVASSRNPSEVGEHSVSAISKGPILHPGGVHYQVTSVEDMMSFRHVVLSSLNLSNVIPTSFCHHSSNFPRIGILSRRHSRRIKQVKDVAEQLKEHYKLKSNIPVFYFENAAFQNQVGMMASVDILITPHGAQETGIAFMPRCGGVLELLPDKYFFPRFYGTLAATLGLEHAYIYLANNVSDRAVVDITHRDIGFLQPSIDRIKEGVSLLVERWRRCCEDVVAHENHFDSQDIKSLTRKT